jgi:hypothetical protein
MSHMYLLAEQPTSGSLEQLATAMLQHGRHHSWRAIVEPDSSKELHGQCVMLNYQQKTLFLAHFLQTEGVEAAYSVVQTVAEQIAHRNVGEDKHCTREWRLESERLTNRFVGYTFTKADAHKSLPDEKEHEEKKKTEHTLSNNNQTS